MMLNEVVLFNRRRNQKFVDSFSFTLESVQSLFDWYSRYLHRKSFQVLLFADYLIVKYVQQVESIVQGV